MKTLLWIDDIRNPFKGWAEDYSPIGVTNVNIVWCHNYDEVVRFISVNGLPDAVCFDHDLGEMGENERNGFTCAKYIVDFCIDNNCDIPLYNIQSSNPVGYENIKGIMDGWHKFYNRK